MAFCGTYYHRMYPLLIYSSLPVKSTQNHPSSIKHQPCQSNSTLAPRSASLCAAVTMVTGALGPALLCIHKVCNGRWCINVCVCVCVQDIMLQADTVPCISSGCWSLFRLASVSVRDACLLLCAANSCRLMQNKKPQISPNSQRSVLCKKVTRVCEEGGWALCCFGAGLFTSSFFVCFIKVHLAITIYI